jgi:site-specific recombinase XerD
MTQMTGRLEKEIKELEKIRIKLESLPSVINDFYFYLEAADRSYTTIKNYIDYVIHFMLYCTDGEPTQDFYQNVTSATVNMYMSSIRYTKDSNDNTIKIGNSIRATRWSALNTFFNYLKTNNLIANNPLDQTFRPSNKKDKKVIYLTENEIKTCINNVITDNNGRFKNRDLCIISMGISTGLRVSAITQINIEDINLEHNTINVIEKGNKYRTISFGNKLKKNLIAWLQDREKYYDNVETNALFISRKKNRIFS